MKPHSSVGATLLAPGLYIFPKVGVFWELSQTPTSPTSFHFPVVRVPLGWGDLNIWPKSVKDANVFSAFFTCLVPILCGRGHSLPFGFAVFFECGSRVVIVTGLRVTVWYRFLASLCRFVKVGLPGTFAYTTYRRTV